MNGLDESKKKLERDILNASSDVLYAKKKKEGILNELCEQLHAQTIGLEEVQNTIDELLSFDKFIYMRLGYFWTTLGLLEKVEEKIKEEQSNEDIHEPESNGT